LDSHYEAIKTTNQILIHEKRSRSIWRKETPGWAKHIMLGALGYLISPIDALPDLTPLLGYTDDAGVLAFALVVVSGHINEEVKVQARERLNGWFSKVDENALNEVDKEYQ